MHALKMKLPKRQVLRYAYLDEETLDSITGIMKNEKLESQLKTIGYNLSDFSERIDAILNKLKERELLNKEAIKNIRDTSTHFFNLLQSQEQVLIQLEKQVENK